MKKSNRIYALVLMLVIVWESVLGFSAVAEDMGAAVAGEVDVSLGEAVEITLPNGVMFENLESEQASFGKATQLMLMIGDGAVYKALQEGVLDGTLYTEIVIEGDAEMTLEVNPKIFGEGNLLCFEVCLAGFVPVKENSYRITLRVLQKADNTVLYHGSVEGSCTVDPIYIYDRLPFEAEKKTLEYYYEGNEVADKWNTCTVLPNHIPDRYFSETAGYEWEMVVNGTAIYRNIPMMQNYDWGTTVMGGVQFLSLGWMPTPNTEYDLTFNVYSISYPSGNRVLAASFTMAEPLIFEKENVNQALVSHYEIFAEKGYVYIDCADTDQSTVVNTTNDNGEAVTVEIPLKKYTVTAIPDSDFGEFLGWYINGEKIERSSRVYTFTAKEGEVRSVVAKFERIVFDPELKFEGHQLGLDGTSIRFIGSVTNLEYATVDFVISVDKMQDKVFSNPTTKIFQTFTGVVNGVSVPVVATAKSGVTGNGVWIVDAEYLYGYSISGIPAGSYTFQLTPIAKTVDGDTAFGDSATIEVTVGK